MPKSVIHEKIKEALVATGCNRHDALKLLITWAVRDSELLLAMTKPHLKAIASGHIDHYLRKAADNEPSDVEPDNLSRSAINDIISSARGADRRKSAVLPPPKSTERQATAMRKLAAAFTKKKK